MCFHTVGEVSIATCETADEGASESAGKCSVRGYALTRVGHYTMDSDRESVVVYCGLYVVVLYKSAVYMLLCEISTGEAEWSRGEATDEGCTAKCSGSGPGVSAVERDVESMSPMNAEVERSEWCSM